MKSFCQRIRLSLTIIGKRRPTWHAFDGHRRLADHDRVGVSDSSILLGHRGEVLNHVLVAFNNCRTTRVAALLVLKRIFLVQGRLGVSYVLHLFNVAHNVLLYFLVASLCCISLILRLVFNYVVNKRTIKDTLVAFDDFDVCDCFGAVVACNCPVLDIFSKGIQ